MLPLRRYAPSLILLALSASSPLRAQDPFQDLAFLAGTGTVSAGGDAAIVSSDAGIFVAVDRGGPLKPPDGRVDELFELSLAKPLPEPLTRSEKGILLFRSRDAFEIALPGREILAFGLAGDLPRKLDRAGLPVTRYVGTALIERSGRDVESLSMADLAGSPVSNIGPFYPPPDPGSGSGGCARSCSVSCVAGGCSATCSTAGNCSHCFCGDSGHAFCYC